mmetsp:Transcript_125677/g.350074  ORF Transcript_125677/g.350074 Transcript_125677/m.350074 type:complete len:132 (+) Transcript_125677:430-825(+)
MSASMQVCLATEPSSVRFPGWLEVDWQRADLEAGDCIYIPHGWYHQVRAGPSRTVNALVWYWRPARFEGLACVPRDLALRGVRFSDCSWGFAPPAGGEPRGSRYHSATRQRLTQCTRRGRHLARRPMRFEL